MSVETHFFFTIILDESRIWLVTRPAAAIEDFNVDPKLSEVGPGHVFKVFNLGSKIGICPSSELKLDWVGVE